MNKIYESEFKHSLTILKYRLVGVMVIVLASSAEGHWFDPRSSQTRH